MAASSLRLISCGNRASLARIFKPNNIIIALSSVAIHSKSLFSMPPLTLTRPFPSACICRNISGQRAFFSTERHWADVYLEEMKEIANNDSTKLIDVREPWELEKFGHFENAVNIPCEFIYSKYNMHFVRGFKQSIRWLKYPLKSVCKLISLASESCECFYVAMQLNLSVDMVISLYKQWLRFTES